ncbi:MAG: TRAP transporter small permease [Desulfobacterales bacterium]|nr:TRAP transporter small permease [Desulfobacterales bacterium]
MLSRILERINNAMAVLAGLILLFITFSISYSITTRALGIQSPVWTVQFNEYSLLWMTFLGSAWVLSRRKHVAMDVITGQLKPRTRRIADIIHGFMGIFVCGVLFWYSAMITLNLFQRGVTDVQAVDIPKHLIIIVIPFGFLLLILQFLRNLVAAFKETAKDGPTPTQKVSKDNPESSDLNRETKRGRNI